MRYEVAGGVEAGFGPSHSGGVELTTNAEGQAAAEVSQYVAQPGATQVQVQIIRPAAPPAITEPLVIGNTTIAIDWLPLPQPGATPIPGGAIPRPNGTLPGPATTAPAQSVTPPVADGALEVRVTSPTGEVAVGAQAQFRIDITNRSASTIRNVTVIDRFGRGLQHSVSPSPIQRGIGELGPGETRAIGLTFAVREPGRHCHTVEVTADGGLQANAEGCVTARGVAAEIGEQSSIKLTKTGPEQMKVGQTALFTIEVSNTGDKPISALRVTESWRGGLKPRKATDGNELSSANEITWNYNKPLQVGATVRFEVEYEALLPQPENCARATAAADGETATDEVCVEISAPEAAARLDQLELVISDADPVPVGTAFSYRILVRNSGATPQANVILVVEIPESLSVESIQAPVRTDNVKAPVLRFPAVKLIEPGKLVLYELRVTAARAGRIALRAQATSQSVTTPVSDEETTDVFAQTPSRGSK